LTNDQRRRIRVTGIVQGVGFRPFVLRQATQLALTGFVANSGQGVEIEAQGRPEAIDQLLGLLQQAKAPAVVERIEAMIMPPRQGHDFTIAPSQTTGPVSTLIAPDLATCQDCQRELFDVSNRRYRYPFINCTHCGPRLTIIRAIPYDRPTTSMAAFSMCPSCQAEYDDPQNRRFHAQPNACPDCGPQLTLCDTVGQALSGDPFSLCAQLLGQGKTVAIKGLGGFHLAVDARNDAAISRLRQRKGRPSRPLALMLPNLTTAHQLCHLSPEAERLLSSPQRPILLAPRKESPLISPLVAPGLGELGLMLPYTPLHFLLAHAFPHPLVMTSANRSEEPLCIDNQEALRQLTELADAFLLHDRPIVCRADDSVVTIQQGQALTLRRGRGQAPTPIKVRSHGPQVLAVGGELKNTICLLKGGHAFLSQHLGDLKNLAAAAFFRETISHFLSLFQGDPALIVHDLHPGYLSSQWATDEGRRPTLAVQHHHAHLAACLAENQHDGPALGLILDGTGLGWDQTIWGGEVLIGDAAGCERLAWLEPMPLPGGEIAIRQPWRAAVGYLSQIYGEALPALPFLDEHDWGPVAEIAQRGIHSPQTSSCGRLFDAVAAMAGGRQTISYEGQAAIELMAAANGKISDQGYELGMETAAEGGAISLRPLVRQVVIDIEQGASLAAISQRFHRTLIEMLTVAVKQASARYDLRVVALSGGVFVNPLMANGLRQGLGQAGLVVLSHSRLPPGDGCLALGQAMIGRRHLLGTRPPLQAKDLAPDLNPISGVELRPTSHFNRTVDHDLSRLDPGLGLTAG